MIKEQEARENSADVFFGRGISPVTFYKYKSHFGGMEPTDSKRLRVHEDEDGKLKQSVAGTDVSARHQLKKR